MPKKYFFSLEELEWALKNVKFNAKERKIFELFYFKAMSSTEISDMHKGTRGWSVTSVKRGVVNIRRKINEHRR